MKKMKKFFTLSRRAEGFTLVELIVVIAILAILGGVAVPAYSGYVKKANMQADMTLISEIEQALQLAYYSQDLNDASGYVILMPDLPAQTESDAIIASMTKTFGESWNESLQLKYSDWGVTAMSMSHEEAQKIRNSNYVQKYTPEELMTEVQTLTNAVENLNIAMDGDELSIYQLYNTADGGNVIDDAIKEYYGENTTKTWEDLEGTAEGSNLLVLATASGFNSGTSDVAALEVVQTYAMYAAFAEEENNGDFEIAYENFKVAISGENVGVGDLAQAYGDLKTAANNNGFSDFNKQNHYDAFRSVMQGVGNAMTDNRDAILGDLNNSNMFTAGVGSELYNDYLSTVYAMASDPNMAATFAMLNDPEFAGCVMVWYSLVDGCLYLGNSIPKA